MILNTKYQVPNTNLVSVVIPTYNKAQYLKEAIESVLNQTYKNIEIIVIDDGSTDESREVVNSFTPSILNTKYRILNPIIYFWQENKGAAMARNTGIKKAKGKYIAFLDSDDLWLREKLEKQVSFMEENPETGLLGTGCYEITNKGKIIGQKIFPIKNKDLQKDLIKYNPFIQSSVVVKREVFSKVGLYNKGFRESEDYELWLRIGQNYKIGNLPEPLVRKRYYKKGLSPTKDKKQLYFVLRAKKAAIRRGQYPKRYYLYVLKSWIFMKIPFFLRRIIRIYLLKKKFNYDA